MGNAVERTKSVISRSMDVVLTPNFSRKRNSEPTRRGQVAIDSRCYAETEDTPALPPSGRAPGLAMGFLTEDCRQHLDTKRGNTPQRTARLPDLLQRISSLMKYFPEIPKLVLVHQVLRQDGNCWEVYSQLLTNGWQPRILEEEAESNPPHVALPDFSDIHIATPYFFGPAPPKRELQRLLVSKPKGTFLTYYRYACSESSSSLVYFICYKNQAGEIVERAATAPNVPEFLKTPMRLTGYISAPFQSR